VFRVQRFRGSGFRDLGVQVFGVQEFRGSGVQGFRSSGVQVFRCSGFRDSGVQGSGIQGLRVQGSGVEGSGFTETRRHYDVIHNTLTHAASLTSDSCTRHFLSFWGEMLLNWQSGKNMRFKIKMEMLARVPDISGIGSVPIPPPKYRRRCVYKIRCRRIKLDNKSASPTTLV